MSYGQGQLDMLVWLSGTDPDDDPMAPVCLPVRRLAWCWCLAWNIHVVAAQCESFLLGKHHMWHAMLDDGTPCEWRPGCGYEAPGWRDE